MIDPIFHSAGSFLKGAIVLRRLFKNKQRLITGCHCGDQKCSQQDDAKSQSDYKNTLGKKSILILGLNPTSCDSPKKGEQQKGRRIVAKKRGEDGKMESALGCSPTHKFHHDAQSQKSQDNGQGLDQADDGDGSVHAGLSRSMSKFAWRC